jgi:chemotaxis family two-component system sensor kinase Cph1
MSAGPSTPPHPEPPGFVLDLTTCDREPIHIPGAIQAHGILFALSGPHLTISAVSANVAQHLAAEPASLLGLPIADLVDAEAAGVIHDAAARTAAHIPSSLRIRLNATAAATWRAAVHRTADGILLEADLPRPYPNLDSTDMFDRYDRATRRLRTATDTPTVCQRLAEEIHGLTGFDRVKVYRFARDWSGEVIAEAANDTLPSYLGLHFPATDIPVQARALYRRNLERLIPDIDYIPVPLIQANPDPIDLGDISLRSVSPIHIEYLHNMRVGASMSLSIMRDGELWGLVACHHATPHYLPPEIRQAGMLLAQLVSWQLALVEETETLRLGASAKTIETGILHETTSGHDHRECLLRHGAELLSLLGAGGLALGGGGTQTTLGVTPEDPDLHDLMAWLAQRDPGLLHTEHLAEIYPPAANLPVAAGLLAVPLGGTPDNLMVWFRPEIARTVTWGGDPSKPVEPDSTTGRLHPRLSFATWKETVRGRSRPWETPEIAVAQSLRDTVAELIVRRSLQLEAVNAKLIRTNEQLESFAYVASHDLKEPLRQIETFGTMLERVFDNRAPPGANPKHWFEGIQAASRRLRMLIDDLAEYSRLGRHANPFAPCDLNAVLEEVRIDLGVQIAETQALLSSERLPAIMCDHVQMRQLMQNLVSNALKYHHRHRAPEIRIAATIHPGGNSAEIARLPVLELTVADNGIGFEERHRDRIFEPFQRLHSTDVYEGSGIGLAICRKIVDRHGGVISATSTPGVGSVFRIRLPLRPLPNGA